MKKIKIFLFFISILLLFSEVAYSDMNLSNPYTLSGMMSMSGVGSNSNSKSNQETFEDLFFPRKRVIDTKSFTIFVVNPSNPKPTFIIVEQTSGRIFRISERYVFELKIIKGTETEEFRQVMNKFAKELTGKDGFFDDAILDK